MSGIKILVLVVLLCSVAAVNTAYGAKSEYGVLLGTFSGKIRGIEAMRTLRADKNLTSVTLLLAKQKNVYGQHPGYILVAGPFAFASKAQKLAKRMEQTDKLVRTAKWPAPGEVVAVLDKQSAGQESFRLPTAPPDPAKEQSEDGMRRTVAAMELDGGSKFNSNVYYDDDTNELGSATSMEIRDGKVANNVYTEFSPGEGLDVSVRGKALAEAPVGSSKIRGVVDYSMNQIGSERIALSHVWQPGDTLETEVGVASEVGGNPARNVFGSVSKEVVQGVRLTQRMDVYEQGEIKTFSGIGLTF